MEEAAAAAVRKPSFSARQAVGEENRLPWTENVVPHPVGSLRRE